MTTVLIVDDESGIREILARWLTGAGYTVREACDAESALVDMAETPATVVLCDLEMPGQGGLWLATQLRLQFPTTAIVLATAVDSVPPTTSFRHGIVDYLVKPFSRRLVLDAVAHGATWHDTAMVTRAPAASPEERLSAWLAATDTEE